MRDLFVAAWSTLNTPMVLPWIGATSPFKMFLFYGLLHIVIAFINRLWGGGDDD